jgi:hypothetical protein
VVTIALVSEIYLFDHDRASIVLAAPDSPAGRETGLRSAGPYDRRRGQAPPRERA